MNNQIRNTWLFLGFMVLAAAVNCLTRTPLSEWDALMTCCNYVILVGLLLFWIRSVRVRLLPSGAKRCVLGAAHLMLFYMLVRIFKYRFATEVFLQRYTVYAYWIPQMLIPALFLITCIRIRHGKQERQDRRDVLLLIPGAVLALMAMTNDLHSLVYISHIPMEQFAVDTGTYTHGPLYYILYVWMALACLAGLLLLFREAGRVSKKALAYLGAVVLCWIILFLLNSQVFYRIPGGIHPFNSPEVNTFGMLGVFEVCIRFRLIPHNENYIDLFRTLRLPVLITDRSFHAAYSTETALSAGEEDLRKAVEKPVALSGGQKLCGKEIRAGYAFWTVDESGIIDMQRKLAEANETIEQENDLLRAEAEQKEKDAYLQSRHRIYHEIAGELYPVQKKIGEILEQAVPGTDDFQENIAKISVLNAYVKRKTNLLLLAAEEECLSLGELFLAIQESAAYLTLAGLHTTASKPEDGTLPAGRIIALYDSFEELAQQLYGKVSSLMVSWNGDGLRLAAAMDEPPVTEKLPLPVRFRKSEDILYIDISAGRGGEES